MTAIVMTTASYRRRVAFPRRRTPNPEPTRPPTNAAEARQGNAAGSNLMRGRSPQAPTTDLTRLNAADTPTVSLDPAHLVSSESGPRKDAPPPPVNPEISPLPAPQGSAFPTCSRAADGVGSFGRGTVIVPQARISW
jgi:hypothetical protein